MYRLRADNMITWVSPSMSGVKLYAQYSNGMGDDSVRDREKERYALAGISYETDKLAAMLFVDRVLKSHEHVSDIKDATALSVGGHYKFDCGASVYLATQYGWNEDTLQFADLTGGNWAKWSVGEFEGFASTLGVNIPWSLGVFTVMGMYADGDGTAYTGLGAGPVDKTHHDLSSKGMALANLTFLSKRTFLYTGLAYKEKKDNDTKQDIIQAALGVSHYF